MRRAEDTLHIGWARYHLHHARASTDCARPVISEGCMALIEDVVGVRCCHCERSDAISSPVDAYHTVKTLPRRKAGAHPSSAQQADKWIPAFRRGRALLAVPSRAGRPPG